MSGQMMKYNKRNSELRNYLNTHNIYIPQKSEYNIRAIAKYLKEQNKKGTELTSAELSLFKVNSK